MSLRYALVLLAPFRTETIVSAGRPSQGLFYTAPISWIARPFLLKAAGAGSAGGPTRLSLADRDLVCQDRKLLAALGAPAPSAHRQLNLAAV